jgi:hypothetical protein
VKVVVPAYGFSCASKLPFASYEYVVSAPSASRSVSWFAASYV